MNASALLRKGLEQLEIAYMERQVNALETYMDEILLWNGHYKLVSVENREELIVRHILDSLAPLALLQKTVESFGHPLVIADAGSGNGLPGIPLAIFMPGTGFSLLERSGRRAAFLRNAIIQVFPDRPEAVTVVEGDIRRIKDRFSLIIFRAFRPLPDILDALDTLAAQDGVLFAYKGRRQAFKEELNGIPQELAQAWNTEIVPLSVPFLDSERHVGIMRRSCTAAAPGLG